MILEHHSPAMTAEQGFDISPEKDLTCSSNLASQSPLAQRSTKAHECAMTMVQVVPQRSGRRKHSTVQANLKPVEMDYHADLLEHLLHSTAVRALTRGFHPQSGRMWRNIFCSLRSGCRDL